MRFSVPVTVRDEMVAPPASVERPVTVNALLCVVAPEMTSVLFSVVAPATESELLSVEVPATITAL